ncbi:MAG: competence/damage-inducible protein A [Bacteroidales bacterium]
MKAAILTIGDELLIGQVVDTNSAWISEQLNLIGITVKHKISIGDVDAEIIKGLNIASQDVDFVFITGGLGPTRDDITKSTLCHYFNTKLVFNEEVYKDVESIFLKRNLPMIDSNRMQAMLPESCTVIRNLKGTAPGMWFKKNGVDYFSMPGVPFEMKAMMTDSILPLIKSKYNLPVILHRTILTHGVGESFLAKKIDSWENNLSDNIKLAYLPSPEYVRLRMSIKGEDVVKMTRILDEQEELLKKIIGKDIFGSGNQRLPEVVGKILLNAESTLSTAESCTGGNIARLITSIPGSSEYFKGSVVAYSNEVKSNILNVSPLIIKEYGAVSEDVVKQMAIGVRNLLGTDFSIATSGVAGPDGGTPEKPVGTVWIAVSGKEKTIAKKFLFANDREINISRSSYAALDYFRRFMLGYL